MPRFFLAILFCLALASCQEKPATEPCEMASITRGPFVLRITANKRTIDVNEELLLTISAESPENFTFDLLESASSWIATAPRLSKNGTLLFERSCRLEPPLEETWQFPSMKGIFRPTDPAGAVQELETEPFTIQVNLPPDVFVLDETGLEPATSMNSARSRRIRLILWSVFGFLLLSAVFWIVFHRKKTPPPPPIPPYEKAFAAIKALLAQDYIGKNRIKEFYLEISGILRIYIEEQFAIRAPELTTPEFLEILSGSRDTLLAPQRTLLQNFLTHCDMVKFAELQPNLAEINDTVEACKAFIFQTRNREAVSEESRS